MIAVETKVPDLADEYLRETVRALPKVDLHRHLEGSVRLETLVAIAGEYGIEMPEYNVENLRPFVQMMPGETRNAQHFLAKFHTLRQFFRSQEVARRIAREAVEDAAADNVRYLELRFTPPAFALATKASYEEVVDWISSEVQSAARQHGIEVRLILSMNRHESVEMGEQVYQAACSFRDRGVVALDICGDEAGFSARPFRKLFERVKEDGFGITIHAGEWAGAENIRDAIDYLHADRIGHGVRAFEDRALVDQLAERGVVLELCPTSNYQSGVVADWPLHPLPALLRQKVPVTINTDDPMVSAITLSDEMARAITNLSLTLDDVKQVTLTAARAAFLPPADRAALVEQFESGFTPPS
jgi:adenosine deaminase